MRFGIDFGTTRTVIAYVDRGNYPILSFHDEEEGAIEWFPSVVAEKDGEILFGFDALAKQGIPGWSALRSFKRLLSGGQLSTQGQVKIGERTLSVMELLTGFLLSLREAIFTRSSLASSISPHERLEAVIAAPANAFCTQRFLTLEAFGCAGFQVLSMLNEPAAAGFEYTHRYRKTINARREYVVVYDLGGGTFDASLVHMQGHRHDAVITSGINHLGGDDFDAKLAELVLERADLLGERIPRRQLLRLVDLCREAKEQLNPNSRKIVIDLEEAMGDDAPEPEILISAQDFYEACAPLVERTIEAMMPVIQRLDGEIPRGFDEDAMTDVAGIYVVGGASALPVISRGLRAKFGRRVHRSPYPHAATAIGLAIACDESAGFELSDRFSRNFGVFREAQGGREVTYDPIFTREMELPKLHEGPRTFRRVYQPVHNVGHFRFFECSALDERGVPQGDMAPMTEVFFPFDPALRSPGHDLASIPVQRLSGGSPRIEEQYQVDHRGMVEVTISDLDSGYRRSFRLGSLAA